MLPHFSLENPAPRFVNYKLYRIDRLLGVRQMLSNKAQYALRALILLSQRKDDTPVQIADIAEQGHIPKKFLELILLELKRHGLLRSRKGPGGGYLLAKGPDEISVAEVVRAIDGPLALVPCVSLTAYARCQDCVDELGCGVRLVMKDVRDAVAEILEGTTFADVVRRIDEAKAVNAIASKGRKRK
jgi:Rrf2 family protein